MLVSDFVEKEICGKKIGSVSSETANEQIASMRFIVIQAF